MNVHQSLAASRPLESFSPPDSVPAKADAMVRFEGVEKTYPAYRGKPSVRALQNIDFAVPRGSITGVIGRSGAGKSSLVRLINGLEKPTTGRVEVDGRDISALSGRELRLAQRSIGMIFQHFNLLSSRTAAANIALPLEIAGWSKADIAVRVAELLDSSISPTSTIVTPPNFPAARNNASALHARWRRGRACCCRMRRLPRSIRRPPGRSSICSPTSTANSA